jgi:hypothetical protein
MKQSIFNKSFDNKSLGPKPMSPSTSLPLLSDKLNIKKIETSNHDYNESVLST